MILIHITILLIQSFTFSAASHLSTAREDAELALAVAVERELGEESAWWPYLKLLDCSSADFLATLCVFFSGGKLCWKWCQHMSTPQILIQIPKMPCRSSFLFDFWKSFSLVSCVGFMETITVHQLEVSTRFHYFMKMETWRCWRTSH